MDVDYAVRVNGGAPGIRWAQRWQGVPHSGQRLEPVEHAQPAWHGEGGTQGTHIAAKEAFDE